MSKPVYRMSESGGCTRVLSAQRLGHEGMPLTPEDEKRLQYYTWIEDIAVKQMQAEGLEVIRSGLCPICGDRYGFHVEIETELFKLIGHEDAKVVINDRILPVEIKSMGRFVYPRFIRTQFATFPDYAGQEACYLHHEDLPGIYWIVNRDTGEYAKYIINNDNINLPGFINIGLPITFEQVIDRLNYVELCVRDNELANVENQSDEQCRYCSYKFLCAKPEEVLQIVELPGIIDAAKLYTDGDVLVKEGTSMKNTAKDVFLDHAKSGVEKFKVGRVSVSYKGLRTMKSYDEALLRATVDPEILKQATKESKPFEDIYIRITGEKDAK